MFFFQTVLYYTLFTLCVLSLTQGETGKEDGLCALNTLFTVVSTLVRVMAPYTPFLTEHMYQHLKKFVVDEALGETEKGSVHFLMLPQPRCVRYSAIEQSFSTKNFYRSVFHAHSRWIILSSQSLIKVFFTNSWERKNFYEIHYYGVFLKI